MDTLIDHKGIEAATVLNKLDYDESDEPLDQMYEHNGMLFHSKVTTKQRLVEELPKWKAREDDVYVIGFPKSGTTWTQEITYLALRGGDTEQAQRGHNWIRVPFLEASPQPPPKGHLIILETDTINEMMASPRVFKSHLPEFMLPPAIYSKKAKIVYVMRNPKDVVVSYFHYHNWQAHLPSYDSWDVFFDDFISGKVLYGNWHDQVLSYWKKRNNDNILFLKYEDMKKNEKEAVKRISEFLGFHYSDDILERIVQHTTFKSMKANPMTNPDAFGDPKRDDPSLSFIRKGVVGDWKNYFSDVQSKAIEDLCEEKFAGTGLTIDFE